MRDTAPGRYGREKCDVTRREGRHRVTCGRGLCVGVACALPGGLAERVGRVGGGDVERRVRAAADSGGASLSLCVTSLIGSSCVRDVTDWSSCVRDVTDWSSCVRDVTGWSSCVRGVTDWSSCVRGVTDWSSCVCVCVTSLIGSS